MNPNLIKLIDQGIKELPQDFQEAIQSLPWQNIIHNIAMELKFSPEKEAGLLSETALVLIGYEEPNNFLDHLKSAGLNSLESLSAAEEVHEKIILPIDKKLQELQGKNTASKSPTEIFASLNNASGQNTPLSPSEITSPPEREAPKLTSTPNYSAYESGKDPYREPVE